MSLAAFVVRGGDDDNLLLAAISSIIKANAYVSEIPFHDQTLVFGAATEPSMDSGLVQLLISVSNTTQVGFHSTLDCYPGEELFIAIDDKEQSSLLTKMVQEDSGHFGNCHWLFAHSAENMDLLAQLKPNFGSRVWRDLYSYP